MRKKLSKDMSVADFENGYWYATELKEFARAIGIDSIKFRKDELEKVIIKFLKTGKILKLGNIENSSGPSDLAKGLSLKLPVINYVSDKETKSFLMKEALKIDPKLPKKSGARYWLNRWREEQIERGIKITYGDLVKQFIHLSRKEDRLPRIPSTRFNNFITDFLANQKNGRRADAMKAWEELKEMNLPKNYQSWKRLHAKK